jgi:ADP-ribose pyrophosphatase YjhB (NUDIX family)
LEPTIRFAVAAAVTRDDGLVLAVRRPDAPGEELPGIWGLPAVTLTEGESPEDGVRRIGRQKLGCELSPLQVLANGEQHREGYTLRMTVYDASMSSEPQLVRDGDGSQTLYDAIDWLPPEDFREAAARGSLCCALFLEATRSRRER